MFLYWMTKRLSLLINPYLIVELESKDNLENKKLSFFFKLWFIIELDLNDCLSPIPIKPSFCKYNIFKFEIPSISVS